MRKLFLSIVMLIAAIFALCVNKSVAMAAEGDIEVVADSPIRLTPKVENFYSSRVRAEAGTAVLRARLVNYSALGSGDTNKDKRLVFQIDTTNIASLIAGGGWIKMIESDEAAGWNCLSHLGETVGDPETKVRITTPTNAVAVLSDNTYSILAYFEPTNNPLPNPDLNPDLPPSAPGNTEVDIGLNSGGKIIRINISTLDGKPIPANVLFYLWLIAKDSSGASVQDLSATSYGHVIARSANGSIDINVDNLEDSKGRKVSIPAGSYTIQFADKSSVDAGVSPKYIGTLASVYLAATEITPTPIPTPSRHSSGGCDAGFGAAALLLAACFVLKKR
ncbi:hypothetical protein AGMMS50276_16870 [Synergistales bacterium]|nr:hypothetical protein AGMMS50276_16870 [Synergistales bacterium]